MDPHRTKSKTSDLREVFSSQHAQTTHCSQKAGLFSAVVTSFAVDSYKWLQPGSSPDISSEQHFAGFRNEQFKRNSLGNLDEYSVVPQPLSISVNCVHKILGGFESTRWKPIVSNAETLSLCGRCGLRDLSTGVSHLL